MDDEDPNAHEAQMERLRGVRERGGSGRSPGIWLALVIAIAAGGWLSYTYSDTHRAAEALGCSALEVEFRDESESGFTAVGCGRSIRFRCVDGGRCVPGEVEACCGSDLWTR